MVTGIDRGDRRGALHGVVLELHRVEGRGREAIGPGAIGRAAAAEHHGGLALTREPARRRGDLDVGVRHQGAVAVLEPDRSAPFVGADFGQLGDPVGAARRAEQQRAAGLHLRIATVDIEPQLLALQPEGIARARQAWARGFVRRTAAVAVAIEVGPGVEAARRQEPGHVERVVSRPRAGELLGRCDALGKAHLVGHLERLGLVAQVSSNIVRHGCSPCSDVQVCRMSAGAASPIGLWPAFGSRRAGHLRVPHRLRQGLLPRRFPGIVRFTGARRCGIAHVAPELPQAARRNPPDSECEESS